MRAPFLEVVALEADDHPALGILQGLVVAPSAQKRRSQYSARTRPQRKLSTLNAFHSLYYIQSQVGHKVELVSIPRATQTS